MKRWDVICSTCEGAGKIMALWSDGEGGKPMRCPTCHGRTATPPDRKRRRSPGPGVVLSDSEMQQLVAVDERVTAADERRRQRLIAEASWPLWKRLWHGRW